MQVPEDIANLAGPPPGAPPSIMIGGPGGAPGQDLPPPGPGGPSGGLPPELLQALAGGGNQEPASPLDALLESEDEGELFEAGRSVLSRLMDIANDDVEKAAVASALQGLQKVFAKRQTDKEAASGTTPALRGMAKALSG